MKHTNFGFLLREGVRAMFKHGFMSFAAICITVACLVAISSFGLLFYNLNNAVDEAQSQTRILAVVDEAYSEAEAKSVGSQINLVDNVENAVFVSREQAFENFTKGLDKDLFPDSYASMLRDQFVITLEDNSKAQQTIDDIEKIPGVAEVYAKLEVMDVATVVRYILFFMAIVIAGGLCVGALVIIIITIRMAMMDRREEIGIMKMVGATNGFICLPFLVEGFFLGVLGGVFAFFAEWGLYEAIRSMIANIIDTDKVGSIISILTPVPFGQLWLPVAALCGVAGLVIGVFGSLMSIRRFLKV